MAEEWTPDEIGRLTLVHLKCMAAERCPEDGPRLTTADEFLAAMAADEAEANNW